MTDEQKMEIALFRYGVIHPLLDENLQKGEKATLMKQILGKTYDIPLSSRTTISERTLFKYLQWYREGGFQALLPQQRKDAGCVKVIPDDVLKKAFEFKNEIPTRSVREIIQMLELTGVIETGSVKNSTLSRILSERLGSLTGQSSQSGTAKTFGRFQKEVVNDTWQSDVKHCIYIRNPKNPGEYIKTYLVCFLDDRSRRVCGKIYFQENAQSIEDCFRKALIQMGIPRNFYTDNAKAYRTKRLQLICAELSCSLKYHRPYSPESKGKLEKFNAYVDRSFEPEARRLGINTIEELNEYFEYWVTENYNNKIHHQLKATPNDIHKKASISRISPEKIKQVFIQRQERKVDNAATFSLNGNLYKVEKILARKKIEVRFDLKDLSKIEVYRNGEKYKNAEPLIIKNDVWDKDEKNVSSVETIETSELRTSFLKLLKEKYEGKLKDKANRINYVNLYGNGKEEDTDV